MKTASLSKIALLLILLVLAMPLSSYSYDIVKEEPAKNETANSAEVQRLISRIAEIKAMDMKNMTKSEKKALRKEVREIKREVNALSGGVYISIGALILIALLLILLL